ncbi:MAG: methyl-accepting chemotaxis protein [Thermodesulfobacteriota bacterium]|nr:methyl-accepting chemotaxis protein [Thermodesulfobacteriota bacterium]
MNKKIKRKKINYSIKKKMQLRLLGKISLILIIGIVISGLIIYSVSYNYGKTEKQHSFHHIISKYDNFLNTLLPITLFGLSLGLAFGFFLALFYPHKIAGPLYRIERQLLEIGKGNLDIKLKLRKGDEVEDLSNNINIMVNDLKDKIIDMKNTSNELISLIDKLEESKVKKRLMEEGGKLHTKLNSFKLSNNS